MCVIVDANLASLVFANPPREDFHPLLRWLLDPDKDGCLIFGGHLAHELGRVGEARRALLTLLRAGRAKRAGDSEVSEAMRNLSKSGLCRSNDHHVLALAQVSGARLLCSHDGALQQDFRDPKLIGKPRGKVYQRRQHSRLLLHTSSCGLLRRGGRDSKLRSPRLRR